MVLPGGGGGHRGAAVRAVGLRHVVRVLRGRVGAAVGAFLGGLRGAAVAVRAVRLRVAVVVVAVRSAGAELPGIRGCGRHVDLQEKKTRGGG